MIVMESECPQKLAKLGKDDPVTADSWLKFHA